MNYSEIIDAWLNLLETDSSEIDFTKLIPRAIEQVELRIYRELDFPFTITTQTGTLTANTRAINLPATMLILRSLNAITPAGSTGSTGTRVPLTRVTNEFLDAIYSVPTITGVPAFYAMLTDTQCLVGPFPDQNYTAEFTGTFRPAPLSPTNTSTFLTTNVPDLYLAAGMVFWSSYYQNYGAGSDDPKMAMSWEQRYQTLFAGINMETLRQKAASTNGNAYPPSGPGASK